MRDRRVWGTMEPNGARDAARVFRLAKHEHLNVAISEDTDVVMLKFSPEHRILLHRIKADGDNVGSPDRSRLKRKIVEQPDKLAPRVLVDIQKTVGGRKGDRSHVGPFTSAAGARCE